MKIKHLAEVRKANSDSEESGTKYNQPCEYGHMHCSTRNEGPCSDEIGHTFEAHAPKDDKKLNKRLQEVLKMIKKWKGPKKLKESVSPELQQLVLDDLSVQDLVMKLVDRENRTGDPTTRRLIIQIAHHEGVALSNEELDVLYSAFADKSIHKLFKA